MRVKIVRAGVCGVLLIAASAFASAFAAMTVANLAAARALADNTEVVISGVVVVTAAPGEVTSNSNMYVSDASGVDGQTGICVYKKSGITAPFKQGDGISGLTGVIKTYMNMREIAITNEPSVASTGNPQPKPTLVTAMTQYGDVDGELVKIAGTSAKFDGPTWKSGTHQLGAQAGPFNAVYIYASSPIFGANVPGGSFSVTGIAKIYSADYEVSPRSPADVAPLGGSGVAPAPLASAQGRPAAVAAANASPAQTAGEQGPAINNGLCLAIIKAGAKPFDVMSVLHVMNPSSEGMTEMLSSVFGDQGALAMTTQSGQGGRMKSAEM